MTRELMGLLSRLVGALEEANQLRRIEMRATGTLPKSSRS